MTLTPIPTPIGIPAIFECGIRRLGCAGTLTPTRRPWSSSSPQAFSTDKLTTVLEAESGEWPLVRACRSSPIVPRFSLGDWDIAEANPAAGGGDTEPAPRPNSHRSPLLAHISMDRFEILTMSFARYCFYRLTDEFHALPQSRGCSLRLDYRYTTSSYGKSA